jgi:predicted  nucleic acid-binding Zn-ribbon protein
MRTHEVDETALIEELPKLYELQVIDLRIGELLEERAQIDDGSTKTAELDRAEARLAHINSQLFDLRGRQIDRRLERDSLTERRERNQQRLWQESPSPAEAEALQMDLQSTATRLDAISIELQDFENRIEPLEHQAEDELRTVSELQSELSEVRGKFAEMVKGIDVELRGLATGRREHAAMVDPALLGRYEMIRNRRGDPGVVRVTEEVCTACQTQLTSYMLRQLQTRQRVQQCENCNTILFWAGEARARLWMEDLREHADAADSMDDDD